MSAPIILNVPCRIKIIRATKWIDYVHYYYYYYYYYYYLCGCEKLHLTSTFTGHKYSPPCDDAVKLDLFRYFFAKNIVTKLQKLQL